MYYVLKSNCKVKNKEMFEDTKRVNRSCKSKDRHYKVQSKKDDNGPQNTTQKSKDWATGIPLKHGVDSG